MKADTRHPSPMNFRKYPDFQKGRRTAFFLAALAFLLMPIVSRANERADRSFALSITHENLRMASDLDRTEGWYVDVLTFDLDNDGDLDAIATDTNCDGPWEVHRFDSPVWSHSIPIQEHRDDPSQYLSSRLFLKSCSFFAVSNRTESARLAGIELPWYGDNDIPQAPNNDLGETVFISLTDNGCAAFTSSPGGRESILSNHLFSSIQRILPVEFRGTNIVETETSWYGYTNAPPAWFQTDLSLSENEKASLRSVLNGAGETNAASCIVLDADGDGNVDAYVSIRSDLESVAESNWLLWQQKTNGWIQADSTVENHGRTESSPLGPGHPPRPGPWDDPRPVAPAVQASALDFYRVYRPDGTTWPAVFSHTEDGSLPDAFHRLFERGAAFMRLERIQPETLPPAPSPTVSETFTIRRSLPFRDSYHPASLLK